MALCVAVIGKQLRKDEEGVYCDLTPLLSRLEKPSTGPLNRVLVAVD